MTLAIYLYTLLGLHMGVSRRNSILSHVPLLLQRALLWASFGWFSLSMGTAGKDWTPQREIREQLFQLMLSGLDPFVS